MEPAAVRLLVITPIPFLLFLSVRIAKLVPVTLRLASRGSVGGKAILLPSTTHASVFDPPVAQTQVTGSPGHTEGLSHVIDISLSVINRRSQDYNSAIY